MYGILSENERQQARKMLEEIAAKQPVMVGSERETLLRLWTDGAKTTGEMGLVKRVYVRIKVGTDAAANTGY